MDFSPRLFYIMKLANLNTMEQTITPLSSTLNDLIEMERKSADPHLEDYSQLILHFNNLLDQIRRLQDSVTPLAIAD
jgi:hypothetical protein